MSPEEALLIIELYGGHGSGEVGDNSLEKSIVDCQTHEHLELVVLAKPGAGGLYLGDELGVHPPELRGPGHRAGSCRHLLGRADWAAAVAATSH